MIKANRPWGIWFLGLALLVTTVGGAVWVVHSRAGDDQFVLPDLPIPTMSKPIIQSDGVVCTGRVDVEGGVVGLNPSLPGQIVEIPVKEDQLVKEGTVLLRLDDRQAQYVVQLAEAGLKAARADLEDAKKAPELQQILIAQQQKKIEAMAETRGIAESKVTRFEDLAKKDLSFPEELIGAKHALKAAEASWSAELDKLREIKLKDPANEILKAQANVAARESTLQQAQLALEQCSLKAPMDGTVVRLLVGKGEMLGPQVLHSAISFCPNKPRMVRVEVEQEYASRVKVGMKVLVQDDVSVAGTWHGTVRSIGDIYQPRRTLEPLTFNDLRTIESVVDLDPGQAPLKIGQKVRVIIGAIPEH